MWMTQGCGRTVLLLTTTANGKHPWRLLYNWTTENALRLNCTQTKGMVVCFSQKVPTIPPIRIGGGLVEIVEQFKLLGVVILNNLKWQAEVDYITSKDSQRLCLPWMPKRAGVMPADIVTIYNSLVDTVLRYAFQVRHTRLTVQPSDQLEVIQWRALRIAHPDNYVLLGCTTGHWVGDTGKWNAGEPHCASWSILYWHT